jgi:hypothetical protein
MTVKARKCLHCHTPIASANPNARWCSKRKCQAARKKEVHRKQYKRKPKNCPVCRKDITDRWPKRTCVSQSCIDIYERMKQEVRTNSWKKHSAKAKADLIQIKKKTKRKGRRSLNKHSNSSAIKPIKDNEYFDHSTYLEEQNEYHKPNGRYCNICRETLYGNFYRKCPQCFRDQNDALSGGYDEV